MRQPPIDYIERTREQYAALGYPPYQWVRNQESLALSIPTKPMHEWRVGLIASGGIYVAGQVAFHFRDDMSYREISFDTPTDRIRTTHFAYDLTDSRRDPNVVFPMDTLRGLVRDGTVGELSPCAYTFMGGIYSARKVRDVLAPALVTRLLQDEVDVVLMVPV